MAADWEILEVVGTEEEAQLICGYLESRGLPSQMESVHSHEFPVNVSALGNVRVEVPTERLDEARQLLAERETLPEGEKHAGELQQEGTGEEGV